MTIQTSGDDRRENEAEKTSFDTANISDERLAELADKNTICKLDWDERIAIAQELIQLRRLISQQSNPPMLLPPPITEADGYRLNTSWHSGAIFRDGANWMLEQAKQMQPTLVITLPDTGSKAFWHGSGKSEVFLPTAYKRWVKEAIVRHCAMVRLDVEVK